MDARELKDEASNYFRHGRYGKAAAAYAELAKLEPNDVQHLMRQGDCYRRDGKTEKALEAYDHAASAYAKVGALLKAIAAYKLILEIDPQHAGTHKQLEALSRQRLGVPADQPLQRLKPSSLMRPRPAAEPPPPNPKEAEKHSDPDSLELDEEPAPPPVVKEPEPVSNEPLELDLDSFEPAAIPSPAPRVPAPPPAAKEPDALELDLDLGTPSAAPAKSLELAAPAPPPAAEPLELELPAPPPVQARPAEPPRLSEPETEATSIADLGIDLLGPSIETEESLEISSAEAAKMAHLTAETTEEHRVLARAARAATRAGTPMESVLADSMREDETELVNAEEIGLTPLADEGEPSLDEVVQERIPLLSELPHEAFVELLHHSQLRRVEAGEAIVREGQPGVSLFVVVKGSVRIMKRKGNTLVELAKLGEGAYFGEMALLHGEARIASVVAYEETDLLEIDQLLVRQLASAYPKVARAVMKFYKDRLLENVLSMSPLFQSLEPGDRPPLLKKFVMKEVPAETVIIREGQKADGLYVIMSGAALVTKTDDEKRERPIVLLREGDVFGEMSLLSHRPVSATVTAKRASILLTLPRQDFNEMISMYPTVLETVSELSDTRARLNEELLPGAERPRTSAVSILA